MLRTSFRKPTIKDMHSLPEKHHCLAVLGAFLLLLEPGAGQSESVIQPRHEMSVKEGQDALFPCSFNTTSSNPDLFWYRQFPNQALEHILTIHKYSRTDPVGKYSATLKKNTVDLKIRGVSPEDEAVYYCALYSASGAYKVIFGTGTQLSVHPNLEPSFPSVYKLKPFSEEKQGKAACLFTDYSPNPLKVSINKEGTKEVNGSVVVVKEDQSASGTASYGIVLWGNADDNFQCHVDAENPKGDSGISPQVIQAEEDGVITFETDERLNLLSLTVLGLRVIFLKTVAFNLLFTFRLWSR